MDRHELARTWAPTLNTAAAAPVPMDERRKMAKTGVAMPDGSFPIPDESHLRSAIRLARSPEQRRHVIKRAKALGLTTLIPNTWAEASAADMQARMAQMVTDMQSMCDQMKGMCDQMGM